MPIILFLVILALLILVHEFGHFIVAKKSGIKVTEFGLGFPPKVWGVKRGETEYSINAVPFGGFVKIFGEDPDDESLQGPERSRSITHKPRIIQAAVLVAGVAFNVLFAWVLISAGYMIGLPTPVSYEGPREVRNVRTIITSVTPDSPAERAGVKTGDALVGLTSEDRYVADETNPDLVSNFIEAHGKEGVTMELARGKQVVVASMSAEEGVIAGRLAVGISMDEIGTLRLPVHLALLEGAKTTAHTLAGVATGILAFFGDAFRGQGSLSGVTGPVGIVGLVGDVSALGFVYLLSFTAVISLNLAVINLLPFPALDGGRLVVVALEGFSRRQFSPKVLNWINGVGFVVLILLMIVITVNDIFNLFS